MAGAISMGAGSFLASRAEEELYASEMASEGEEVRDHPRREAAELALILERERLPATSAQRAARELASDPTVFLRTKVQKELGFSPDTGGAAFGDAVMVGVTYLVAAMILLWPYFFFSLPVALAASLTCTLAALFMLGVVKGMVTRLSLVRAGLQVLIIGSASAGLGFAVGHLVSTLT